MHSLVFALQHLTRLPLPQVPFDERRLGRSGMFFPLAGLILGGILIALDWLAGVLFPPAARAAVVVAGLAALTGGIHLDGFMDTVDGVFSGRPRERKLEIMRDSRVGAFGALAVFCLLLLKYALLTGLAGTGGFPALIMMAVFGRWAMTYALARFPYAREEGLGKLFSRHTGSFELALASLTALVAAAGSGGAGGVIIFFATAVLAHLLCAYFNKMLGGLTGDTYGALNEALEVFVLALYLPLRERAPFLFLF
ncbi:MAG: adenosylcobinamide-GDP ribazoletransferase [Peptococcaceae bacterium]|nr:adenosylcobinamide-GDP ribazoletransferase [Peptococcaceae bacterium]